MNDVHSVALLCAALLGGAALGCPSAAEENVLRIGGAKVEREQIDKDALALLPGGPVGLSSLDAQAFLASPFGPQVSSLTQNLLPIGAESGFSASRDLQRVYCAVYTLAGADFVCVVQGSFDAEAIRRAAEGRMVTAVNAPLTRNRYADHDLFVAGGVGFVVLTPHTLLSGNDTGMRRALDRLRDNRLARSVPSWMIELTETPRAAFSLSADLRTQPIVSAAAQQAPFLHGLVLARVVGNFQPPGMNFVGALSYSDAAAAANGAAALRNLQSLTGLLQLLQAWGMPPPLKQFQVAQQASDVQFAVSMDGQSVALGLGVVAALTQPARWAPAPR